MTFASSRPAISLLLGVGKEIRDLDSKFRSAAFAKMGHVVVDHLEGNHGGVKLLLQNLLAALATSLRREASTTALPLLLEIQPTRCGAHYLSISCLPLGLEIRATLIDKVSSAACQIAHNRYPQERRTAMHVYLVQHGASKSEAEDPQRNLTDKGRGVVERTAEHLAGVGIPIDRIEHSDKLRARQTAEILASKLKPQSGTEQIPGLAPNDDITPMRLRLQDEEKNLMLVGHLPYLSRLLSSLLLVDEDRPVVEFRIGRRPLS